MWIFREIKFVNKIFRETSIFLFYVAVEKYPRKYRCPIRNANQRRNPSFGLMNREKQLIKEIYSVKILIIRIVII